VYINKYYLHKEHKGKLMQFTPTQAVLDNITRGQVLKQKYNRASQASQANEVLINKAKEKFQQGFDIEAVTLVYNTLSKLEKSVDFRQRLSDGGPTEDAIKFYSFGGEAGLAWSRMVLKQQEILKSYTKEITKADTEVQGKDSLGKIPVAKAVDTELKQVTYVAMKAGVDLHGDETSLEDVRLAKESFNKSMMRANLFHMVMTDSFDIIESFLAPTEMILNKNLVQAGEWLVTLQIYDDALWDMIKNDEITGVSIGATAFVEDVE
jgi:Putative phage serine protease XkdF